MHEVKFSIKLIWIGIANFEQFWIRHLGEYSGVLRMAGSEPF